MRPRTALVLGVLTTLILVAATIRIVFLFN